MARVWRNDPTFQGCKYLVLRRDGTVPEKAWFVLLEGDPAVPACLRAYAAKAEELKMDPEYVEDIRAMADEWEFNQKNGLVPMGDPDAPRHRVDDPEIVTKMIGTRIDKNV